MAVLLLEVNASARTDHLKFFSHHLGIQVVNISRNISRVCLWFVFLQGALLGGSKKTPCLLSTCVPCQVHGKHPSLICPKLWENSHLQHNISLSSKELPQSDSSPLCPIFQVLPSKAPFTKLSVKLIGVISGGLQRDLLSQFFLSQCREEFSESKVVDKK